METRVNKAGTLGVFEAVPGLWMSCDRTWSVECLGESGDWYRGEGLLVPRALHVSPGGYLCL